MNNSSKLAQSIGWFNREGPDYDVVLASRVRLSRNLSGHLFPGTMDSDEENEVQDEILNAFSTIGKEEELETYFLNEIEPTERRILLERNLISQDYSLQTHRAVVLGDEPTYVGLINEIDHLRTVGLQGGLSLEGVYERVNALDSLLEKNLDFAVSLDWGYINTEVTNIGTGMRASVMLHLPALVKTSLIDRAFKAIVQLGLNIKGFFGDEEKSLGDMYQISNQITLGVSEKEIREKLENITHQIVNYERKARNELLKKRRIEIEDKVHRAFGILTHCKTITSKEAIELLLDLRTGVAMGIIDIPIDRVTGLLFLSQKSHIQQHMESEEAEIDSIYLDYTRAKLIQASIRGNPGSMEENNV